MKPGAVEVTINGVLVRLDPDAKSTPQRTESLARELVRGLLGTGAAPSLELVRGPSAGARRDLPPPEATWIIGRGDEASWVILDEDLSKKHLEIIRGWDGVTIRDLGSKNGTRVDGVVIEDRTLLRDGAKIELGNCELVFRDPAERHMLGEPEPAVRATPPEPVLPARRASRVTFSIAASICVLATAGLLWVLAS